MPPAAAGGRGYPSVQPICALAVLARFPLRLLPVVALLILLGSAAYSGFWGSDPRCAPMSEKLRGLDLVSFWVPGTVLDAGEPEKLYTNARLKKEFKKLHPSRPPGYPIGYPPPIYQLAAAPQPALDYLTAVRLTFFLVAAFNALAGWLATRSVHVPADAPRREGWRWWALGAAMACPGGLSALSSGQLGGLWASFTLGGLYLRSRGRRLAGGLVMGLLWMKPTLAVPVLAALALLGEGAMVGGMVLGGAAVLATSVAADGLEPWQAYVRRLSNPDRMLDDFWIYRHRQVTARSLAGTLMWVKDLREPVGWAAAAVSGGFTAWLAWRARGDAQDALRADLFVGAVLGWAFFSAPHMFEYDLGQDLVAMVASLAWLLGGRARFVRWGWVSLLVAWAASPLTLLPGIGNQGIAPIGVLTWLGWLAAELVGSSPRPDAARPA